ncbi:ATP synthase protein MI25, partial [Glycine soja]
IFQTDMQARNMLFAAIPSIYALSLKKISIYNEEMIVARCFIGFIIFIRKSLGKTFKVTLDGRIHAIQGESQQFPNPNEDYCRITFANMHLNPTPPILCV